MKKFFFSLLFLITALAVADFSNSEKQYFEIKNLLKNPGIEQSTSSWDKFLGGSLSHTINPTNVSNGVGALAFDPSASGHYVGSSLVTVPTGLYGRQCVGKALFKGGDTNHTFSVVDGSGSTLGSSVLLTAGSFMPAEVTFSCPSSGSFGLRTTATADAAAIYLDDFYLGENWKVPFTTTAPWFVDATIAGADISLGTAGVSDYSEITDSGLTLTNRTGALTAQIPCSTTNASSGTTCSSGSESVGVVFTLPTAGPVIACATFSHELIIAANAFNRFMAAFTIRETQNSAQTLVKEGGSITISSIGFNPGAEAPTTQTAIVPHSNCAFFNFTTAGQKTLRLTYEQEIVNGAITTSEVEANDAETGQQNIHFVVYPLR